MRYAFDSFRKTSGLLTRPPPLPKGMYRILQWQTHALFLHHEVKTRGLD